MKFRTNILLILVALSASFFLCCTPSTAQTTDFTLVLEPLEMENFGGIQSFAVGQYDGKWLVAGGRLDGLHRRQPFASFAPDGRNMRLYVIHPESGKSWNVEMSRLPASIREQLSSTNMQFFQEGAMLYVTGGYGYSETLGDHTTFPYLTAIDLGRVIPGIMEGQLDTEAFRQIKDEKFAVTGGDIERIGNVYFLVGGQKFLGRYNPMGPDHGPGFVQEYTNAIRRFQLVGQGNELRVAWQKDALDPNELHRRDYNVVPQIMADGSDGITAFSGVFRYNADIPFWNCVNISTDRHEAQTNFQQFFNHYHCPNIPLYSASQNEMHTLFLGGIAQFVEEEGHIVQDNDVPFVNTVSMVTRFSGGEMEEVKLPLEMPGLLGSGAEFIPVPGLPEYENGVIKLDELKGDKVLIGYILGGIESEQPNTFWVSEGELTDASATLLKVFVQREVTKVFPNPECHSELQLELYPNSYEGFFEIKFTLPEKSDVKLVLKNRKGRKIIEKTESGLENGVHILKWECKEMIKGGEFWFEVETPFEQISRKWIVTP